MKITPQHYAYMKSEISRNLDLVAFAAWIKAEGRYKDFATRFAFECLRHAGLTKWTCDNLYSYVNDTHIKTALLQIIRELAPETLKTA